MSTDDRDGILIIQASHADLVRLRKYIHNSEIGKHCRDVGFQKGRWNFLTPLVPDGFNEVESILNRAMRMPCAACANRVAEEDSRLCKTCQTDPPAPTNRR